MTVSFWTLTDGVMDAVADATGTHTRPLSPTPFQFPGGEWSLKDLPTDAGSTWVAMVRGSDPNDFIQAALFAHAARDISPFNESVLLVPYLPAARADRGTPLGAEVYAELIDIVNADRVYTIDAHSPVMPGLVSNCEDLSPVPLIRRAITDMGISSRDKYRGIIAPDKGAVVRAEALADAWDIEEVLYVDKERDFDTGHIKSLRFSSSPKTTGRYLVVDDICDGGSTFKMLANAFAEQCSYRDRSKAKQRLDLWVTHGIFSGEADELSKYYYTRVMTTDSHPGHGRVGAATIVVPVWSFMFEYARAK